MNVNGGLAATKVRDFVRMNPLEFLGSQTGDDPQNFLDKIKKIFELIQVTRMIGLSWHHTSSKMWLISITLSGRRIGVQMQRLLLGSSFVRPFWTNFSQSSRENQKLRNL